MYLAIPPQRTNAEAWLAAISGIQDAGGEAFNVVVDIADATTVTKEDESILITVDEFLREHNTYSLSTVANTIFPQGLLALHGPDNLYDAYSKKVLPRMKRMTRDWGRYFERMTAWKKIEGKDVKIINPLDELITCMRSQVQSKSTYRNIYELTIYDPTRDAGKVSGRQCLSFLSFKLSENNELLLTVMYRNHAYLARALGNFIGLGRLQAFVANQVGVRTGSLTCVSTHAWVDAGKKKDDGITRGWASSEAKSLIKQLRSQ